MYVYINMVESSPTGEDDNTHAEISTNNDFKVTKDQLNEEQKQAMAQAVDAFKEACLGMFSMVGRGVRSSRRPTSPSRAILLSLKTP